MSEPEVDVIVPVLNGGRALEACLEAIGRQEGVQARVIVVDNGSDDDSVMIAGRHGAIVLHEPVRSSYAARNRGIRHSTAGVLAFTDADCVPDPGWLRNGVAALSQGNDLAAGSIRQRTATTSAGRHDQLTYLDQEDHVRHGFAATANLFVRAEVFGAVGAFRGDLRSGGDMEFSKRCVARGYRLTYAAQACVWHPPREGIGPVLRMAWRIGSGHGQLAGAESPRRLRQTLSPRTMLPNRDVVALGEPKVLAVEIAVKITAYAGKVTGLAKALLVRRAAG
jgi:GT2 family glycosyltransferase